MEYKTKAAWHSSQRSYEEHNALLLCCTKNRSSILPPEPDCFIFSCVVVWVPMSQSLYRVKDAISWMKKWSQSGEESLALCRILKEHHLYWPYPTEDELHLLVTKEEDWGSDPVSFQAYKLIAAKNQQGQMCIVLSKSLSD